MDSALIPEEVLTQASHEVSKAVIHEVKSSVRASDICVFVEEITLASEMVKAGCADAEKAFPVGADVKLQSSEESVHISEHTSDESISLEERVRQLQAEVLALRKKRADEGRANEKVVSIFASREQAWKAEKSRFLSEQRRLWQELQRAFMEQEVLKQRTQRLSGAQDGDAEFTCEDCEQREGWLSEMKERLREQEFVIMTSMEEAKAEQQEKNTIATKLAKLEVDYCEVNEKLRFESEAHLQDVQKHEVSLTELEKRCKTLEAEKSLALHDVEHLHKSLADARQEKRHYEDLVAEMSTEIHMLQVGAHEKEDIISAMLKKADGDAEERLQIENELSIMRAKFIHAESEKERWHMHASGNSSCIDNELMKPRRSLGSKAESGFDNMRELQRLHDLEIRDLQSAFEEEVRLLKKRLSLFQERVVDLEENVLSRLARNVQFTNNAQKKTLASPLRVINGLTVYKSYDEEDMTSEEFQLSIAKTLLRQYMDTEAQREQQIEKLKKAYYMSKATIEMLHKERSHAASAVSSPRTRGLGDWLELERTRFKLEQRHLQEISAFERQLKARDERMEAFRQQLLSMGRESEQRIAEIETLSKELKRALEENSLLKKRIVDGSGGKMS
ncbi:hypothetical protein GOP47_0023170 [Adiantum capillus-veneris]|uniref:Uncharacterized protein n=1 Tax=Adiantum capillus-veneris TaxID=13818 RepID=A0A9D4U6V4_ADICA|nr:hypothetical protein GOP47_0022617 [Adiantum capillus-veneris]KAI5062631.1 hypothetical protein GOP47_0023170 [Adiantum capillus-veneris]